MEQIAVSFTDGGVPKTGLSPKITIIDLNGNKMVDSGACKELGYGWYTYNFDRYSPEKVYLYLFDGGSALSNDYDRYKFGGNELDAYSNKYSWGRTAAPYFTSVNGRFDKLDRGLKDVQKIKYDDKDLKKNLAEIRKEIKGRSGYDVYKKLDSLDKILGEVKQSVVDTSATNDGNSSKNFSGINGKLDLMAEYVVKIKSELDNQLSTMDEDIAARIMESNESINNSMSNRVTIEQLLQQVERLEDKLNEVVDSIVSERLSKDLLSNYDIRATRRPRMTDDEAMAALGINMGTGEGLNEGMEIGMEEEVEEGIGEPIDAGVNAPVDMQGIAEPVMPETI